MKRFTSFTTAILLAVILIACRESIPPAQLVVIVDASRSSPRALRVACGLGGRSHCFAEYRQGLSTLTVLATGDTASANEARLLSGSEIPRSRTCVRGPCRSGEAAHGLARQLVHDLRGHAPRPTFRPFSSRSNAASNNSAPWVARRKVVAGFLSRRTARKMSSHL